LDLIVGGEESKRLSSRFCSIVWIYVNKCKSEEIHFLLPCSFGSEKFEVCQVHFLKEFGTEAPSVLESRQSSRGWEHHKFQWWFLKTHFFVAPCNVFAIQACDQNSVLKKGDVPQEKITLTCGSRFEKVDSKEWAYKSRFGWRCKIVSMEFFVEWRHFCDLSPQIARKQSFCGWNRVRSR
jgi:hypothetical protein